MLVLRHDWAGESSVLFSKTHQVKISGIKLSESRFMMDSYIGFRMPLKIRLTLIDQGAPRRNAQTQAAWRSRASLRSSRWLVAMAAMLISTTGATNAFSENFNCNKEYEATLQFDDVTSCKNIKQTTVKQLISTIRMFHDVSTTTTTQHTWMHIILEFSGHATSERNLTVNQSTVEPSSTTKKCLKIRKCCW